MTTSTLTSWALLIWNTLKEEGLDPLPVFKKAGADPAKLHDGNARYDVRQMYSLWDHALDVSGDADFGVRSGRHWCPTTFHALGFAWLASRSLLDALQRAARYARLVNNSLIIELRPEGAGYRIAFNTTMHLEARHPAGVDAGLAAIITMSRLLVGPQFAPVRMCLMRPHRAPGKLEALAGCAAEYSQEENALVVDASTASMELATGNAGLARVNEHAAAEYLKRLDKDDIVGAVKASIAELLPTGRASEEGVAAALNMNPRTMQRKLKEEAQSFRGILNEAREEIALDYIRNSQLSLTEIGYLLGFADQANFTRAFRRWAGCAPSQYRTQLRGAR